MSNIKELEMDVAIAKAALLEAERKLLEEESKAENNVFDELWAGHCAVEDILLKRASKDCEGSHNCGKAEYTQEFIVDGVKYLGTLKCEYNRHDKRYYYVDEYEFRHDKV